jgi:hypothetical protein
VPELRVALRRQLQLVHRQAAALPGGADEALVEGHVGAQAGDFLVALGQRRLQVGIGLAADLVGTREDGIALFQHLDPARLLAQPFTRVGGRRCERAPGAPQPQQQGRGHQRGQRHARVAVTMLLLRGQEAGHRGGIASVPRRRQAGAAYRLPASQACSGYPQVWRRPTYSRSASCWPGWPASARI